MITVNCPQNSYNPCNAIDIQRRHVFSGFNCRGRMAETSALFSLFAWLLEGFVLTACKKKMLCQVSKLRELQLAIYANWRLKHFSESPDGKRRRQIVSIKFFLHSETQKREVFQDDFLHENILLLNDSKTEGSDSMSKGTKISCV